MDEHIEAALMEAGQRINALQANERRLIDELAALRKDAERYRKLRAALGPGRAHSMTPRISVPFEPAQTYTPEGLDAALDALPAVGDA